MATDAAWLWAWLVGPLVARFGGRLAGAGFHQCGCGGSDVDVAAGCGALEQEALQGGGALDASIEVGENGGEVGGAEGGRDGGECGCSGATTDSGDQMVAVAEQDADGVEQGRDVLGQVLPG